jgi:hypothetical protein
MSFLLESIVRFTEHLGRVGEGVVEGVEGAVRGDRDLEAISETRVVDRDGQRVLGRVPEQEDVCYVARVHAPTL